MEGADESNLDATARLKRIGVPVMGHLGLLPQRVHATGGYRQRLLAEAKALQDAGAFAVVLECVESRCAEAITRALKVPTIGIGSGPHTDGQILVIHDALGMHAEYLPSFARRFANLYADGVEALREYTGAVRARTFPGPGEYTMVPQKAADESDNEGAQTA